MASFWRPNSGTLLVVGMMLLFAVLSPNPGLGVLAVITLLCIPMLTWRVGEPPVLTFILGFQWLQAALLTVQATVSDTSLTSLASFGCADVENATLYSLLGVAAVTVGARVTLGQQKSQTPSPPPINRALHLYGLCLAIGLLFERLAIGGLRQPMLALANVHWAGFYLFAWAVFRTRRQYQWLVLATLLEFAMGLSGYFSSFKTPLFVLVIAAVSANVRLRFSSALALSLLLALTVFVGVLWESVKVPYRSYVNQGGGQQVVLVSYGESVAYLGGLVSDIKYDQLSTAVESLVHRIAYVDIFGCVITNVPAHINYQEGALWGRALVHIAVPRLLYPDKPVLLSDSELTNQYSGLIFTSDEGGTSVSMGYVAESYIDFGPLGMWVPLLFLGCIFGYGYRYCVEHPAALVGQAAAVGLLINFYALEINNIKLLGALVTVMVMMALLLHFAGMKIERWLTRAEV